mmetsp:Transcript_6128/g.14642  ORF Transcript_6128/g.14642 Transcript_6128/m.14642 type:complete len:211 (+) Transcript_6128:90-722(+)
MESRGRVFSEYVDRNQNTLSAEFGASSWPCDQFMDGRRASSAPARKPCEAPWEVPPLALPRSPFVRSKRSYSGSGTTMPDELNCNLEDALDGEADDDDEESFDFSMEGLEDGSVGDDHTEPPYEFEYSELANDCTEVKHSTQGFHSGNGHLGGPIKGGPLPMNGLETQGNSDNGRSHNLSSGPSPIFLSILGQVAAEAKGAPPQSISQIA